MHRMLDSSTSEGEAGSFFQGLFATALEGMDTQNPGVALDRTGHPNPVPRVVGPIRRAHPVLVRDLRFLRAKSSGIA